MKIQHTKMTLKICIQLIYHLVILQHYGVTPLAWDYERKAQRQKFPYLHTGTGDMTPSADTFRVNLVFRDKLWYMKRSGCSFVGWQPVTVPFSHSRVSEYLRNGHSPGLCKESKHVNTSWSRFTFLSLLSCQNIFSGDKQEKFIIMKIFIIVDKDEYTQ